METYGSHFKMPRIYAPPYGGPLYWKDETSGALSAAVMAYFNQSLDPTLPLSDEQMRLVIDYVIYYIDAPCWSWPGNAFAEQVTELRDKARLLKTCDDLTRWISECLDLGIDPL